MVVLVVDQMGFQVEIAVVVVKEVVRAEAY